MNPICNFEGIRCSEQDFKEKHVVLLLLIKPSDKNANEYYDNFNYWHHLSKENCAIYLPGYGEVLSKHFQDSIEVNGINNESFKYSDTCFIEVCEDLKRRLKNWNYSGEPELFILQSNDKENGNLDFTNYIYIDINYGLKKGYIDSIPRFMQRLITASQECDTVKSAIRTEGKTKITPRRILEYAIENMSKLPQPVKDILGDAVFYKTSRSKEN